MFSHFRSLEGVTRWKGYFYLELIEFSIYLDAIKVIDGFHGICTSTVPSAHLPLCESIIFGQIRMVLLAAFDELGLNLD